MTALTQPRPFDVRGPLPTGVTVLEASAGTGKTYTIAALTARYVADGLPLERILLVTFTRMATGELRERVRDRLVQVEYGLEQTLAEGTVNTEDPVIELLARGTPETLRLRRDRLAHALAEFDAATIATTHGFCQEVLGGLGIAADLEPNVTFVEDLSDLVDEVVDDLYVRRFQRGDAPVLRRAEAAEIARIAIGNPGAAIAEAVGEIPQMRGRLALAARRELEARKHRTGVMTYDDLLTRLDAALTGDGGADTAARLRARFDVVLVDEFQDTDPVQWRIMRRAFAETGSTLVLIADPKQAIYAFRGADVYAYLQAAEEAAERATLEVNWRSDQGLIDAYDALFADTKLGHEGIVYRRVRAADAHRARRLHRAPSDAPLRLRVVPRESLEKMTAQGYASVNCAREHIAEDLASDVVALLSSGAFIEERSHGGATLGPAPVRPGHIAVLVQTNRAAALIRDGLEDAGVPAVINGAGSVFATEIAQEWLRLLEGLERPGSTTRAHAVALTCFLGWSAERAAAADEQAWETIHRRLYDWARVLRLKGVASLIETITVLEGLPERMLAEVSGERRLTDLRHIGQLLHTAASTEQLGTTALTAWLRRRIVESGQDTNDEERSRRLESDEEAVQVLTIHRSKGLEFGVVYLPFLWEPGFVPRAKKPVFFHDADADDERTIDVALEGAAYSRHRDQHIREQRGEDLRLAYVALTRARHQAVVWWAGSWDSRNSPLGRLLFARDDEGNVAPSGGSTPTDAAAFARFEALAAQAPGRIAVERSVLGMPSFYSAPLPQLPVLTHAAFERDLDWRWRRTSYSDITAGAHDLRVGSEPEESIVDDEPAVETPATSPQKEAMDPALAAPSLLGAMPVGLRVGTIVHRVLAAADFAAEDLDSELAREIGGAGGAGASDLGDPGLVVAGLRAAIETPLGPILDGLRLRDVQPADRLNELDFELPLVGGDEPTGSLTLERIGQLLASHLPAEDPLAGYADHLDEAGLRPSVRGYLTGSLDLVIRLPGAAGTRYAVLDYKTNWLAGPDEHLSAWHYRPKALTVEMLRRHYALQALLYSVALHRYLRWRVPRYDAGVHLSGVLYLFLRGMVGPATPVVERMPCGVFAWRPPAGLINALSDALDRGAGP